MRYLKQSTAITLKMGPFLDETDGKTAEAGLAIAQADVRLSKNGGAFAQKNDANAAVHDENGWYGVQLDITDTNTLGRLIVAIHEAGALPVWVDITVVTANVWDTLCGADKLEVDLLQMGGVAQSVTDLKDFADAGYDPATDKVQGVVLVDTTTAVTNDVGITQAGADKVWNTAARTLTSFGTLVNDVADQVWDELRAGHVGAGSFGQGVASVQGNVTGNILGTVASVVGNLGGNVLGTIGDLAAAARAAVNAEVDTALADIDLDHFIQVAAGVENPTIDSYLDQILNKDGAQTFNPATDSLEAIRDNMTTPPTVGAIADAVWDEMRAGHVLAGSFGQGVASVQGNVTGSVASVVGNVGGNVVGTVASVVGNVGGNVVGTVASVVGNVGGSVASMLAAGRNQMADSYLVRNLNNVDGVAPFRSVAGAAGKQVNRVAQAAGVLTIYQTDDVTPWGTQNITEDVLANPIVEFDTV